MSALIVVPAFNEAENIANTLAGIRGSLPGVDMAVVDDGSGDETAALALAGGAIVMRLPVNLGYGGALQTGFQYAQAHGYDVVVQMDADGQHEPTCVPDLLKALEEGDADIVIGSRFLGRGEYRAGLARVMGMKLMRWLIRVTVGVRITDPTSGFQALGRRAIALYASPVYPVDYPDADVLIMVCRAGLRVKEVGVTMYPRLVGMSMHSGLKPIWYLLKILLSVGVTLLRRPPALARER